MFDVGTRLTAATPNSPLLLEAFLKESLKGNLLAWDPSAQRAAFRVPHPSVVNGGVLATAGGLVFQGVEGEDAREDALVAYDAKSGKKLWSHDTQEVPVAPPVTYVVDGEQYIAVGVGRGGTIGMFAAAEHKLPPNGRFMAFKLGGKATLPPASVAVTFGDPPAPSDDERKLAEQGEVMFRDLCVRCHGMKGISNRRIPDLRRLPRAYYDSFEAIVLNGAAVQAGMPAFGEVLNQEQVATLKAYVLVEADIDRELRHQPEWWVGIKRAFFKQVAKVVVRFM
jgi:quinohemoprotein ethanol dehydrogenase